jgi:NAD(P) transhydrogenase subunit alpha
VIVGIPKESFPGERRVALVPATVPFLTNGGCEVLVEVGAGYAAGYPDEQYVEKGVRVVVARAELFNKADVILQLVGYGANPVAGKADLELMHRGQTLFGFLRPLGAPETVQDLAAAGITAFAIEMMPRITRAQVMDALSSMSTISGYKAVILAADALPRMVPMLMTAAGTVTPARVLVVGVGVSGLQAIATAKRIGAAVSAYDVRPAAKEQVRSLGAKFVELPLETADAEDAGGYAKAQDESFYRRQQELMAKVVAENDIVITTANVPGRKAPVLITEAMVKGMSPGSVIVDLAAERGGNCALTQAGTTVRRHGITIIGPVNLPSTVPYHASQMYSRNVSTFFLHMIKDGKFEIDLTDEITRSTLVARDGEVVHPQVREALGLEPLPSARGKES